MEKELQIEKLKKENRLLKDYLDMAEGTDKWEEPSEEEAGKWGEPKEEIDKNKP